MAVIQGLYCSYKCADMIDPRDIPQQQWPRQHVVRWKFPLQPKHHFLSQEEAEAFAIHQHKQAYYDNFCGTWHIGTWRERRGSSEEVDGALPEG